MRDTQRNGGRDRGNRQGPPRREDGGRGGGTPFTGFLPLPETVNTAIDGQWWNAENFSLLFHTLIPRANGATWVLDGMSKSAVWKQVVQRGNELLSQKDDVQPFLDRMDDRREILKSAFGRVRYFSGVTMSRLIIGFGNASPLETGITLDPVYGVPYLPGQSIKGVFRKWLLYSLAEEAGIPILDPPTYKKWKDEKQQTPLELLEAALVAGESQRIEAVRQRLDWTMNKLGQITSDKVKNQEKFKQFIKNDRHGPFRQIVGGEGRGKVQFHDAFPQPNQRGYLDLDIVNPHYQEYYQGKQYPADYLNPIPIQFIALRKGLRFRFYLTSEDERLLRLTETWLVPALSELGIGAKTRTGYGEVRRIEEERRP